jgi:dimethylhistidine N-methyltransferase
MNEKSKNKYIKVEVAPNCFLVKSHAAIDDDFAEDIAYGLTRKNKFVSSRHFYDKSGSELFDKICALPEYYLTKKETEILSVLKEDLPEYLDGNYSVVELGSGSATKTRYIFDALSSRQEKIEYYPIDISDVIKESSERLQSEFENLYITGIVDRYESGLDYLKNLAGKKIIVFFGSSIGNFDQKAALDFLRRIHSSMNDGDLFLLGVDLVKDKRVLESAYNDSRGVTAKFNLNLLYRINEVLGGDFEAGKFEHVAFYNSKEKRIEMHLESKEDQQVLIREIDLAMSLKKGERIRTEYSYKYTIPQIRRAAKRTGFSIMGMWTDKQDYFASVLLSKEKK